MSIITDDRLLSDREVAARIGRARSTLQKDRVAGSSPIPFLRVGSSVKYRLSDVEAYLAGLAPRWSTSEYMVDRSDLGHHS